MRKSQWRFRRVRPLGLLVWVCGVEPLSVQEFRIARRCPKSHVHAYALLLPVHRRRLHHLPTYNLSAAVAFPTIK